MTTWGNICRICSSSADYEVFAKIPNYLHATSNEFVNWQKPINVLLEETTGLKVSTDDGLPRYMCALCISYLKHAASFREQAINNALGLKAVHAIHAIPDTEPQRNADKESLMITAKDLIYSEERKTDTNLLYSGSRDNCDKVRKQLLNNGGQKLPHTSGIDDSDAANEHMHLRYLNLLFDKDINVGQTTRAKYNSSSRNVGAERYKPGSSDPFAEDFQTASSDDNEDSEQKQNFFSYCEKNFEEDDIMDLDELKEAITVNIPESCKERKCRACFRRFMFEESYSEHMETCIEYKFLLTIEEINRLLAIRRAKAISPHEFIRRMIFCLRKTCEWLKANCGEMLLPDLLQNGGGAESEGKSSTAEASSGGGDGKTLVPRSAPKLTVGEKLAKAGAAAAVKAKTKMTDFSFNSALTSNDLLMPTLNKDLNLDTHAIIDLFATPKPLLSRTATPISVENNVLYDIERSQSRNKQEIQNKTNATPVQEQERIMFLQKLQNAASTTTATVTNPLAKCETFPPASPMIAVRKDLLPTAISTPNNFNISFSARCNLCITMFANVAELEEHNAVYHNEQQRREQQLKLQQQQQQQQVKETDERDKIIALFEESSDD